MDYLSYSSHSCGQLCSFSFLCNDKTPSCIIPPFLLSFPLSPKNFFVIDHVVQLMKIILSLSSLCLSQDRAGHKPNQTAPDGSIGMGILFLRILRIIIEQRKENVAAKNSSALRRRTRSSQASNDAGECCEMSLSASWW
jgi:hypothetical protein